ncbi:hypothetical protein [Cyanobium sp. Morenito 9A2]|uniref:hypothetical protein n=1 Tax=Cyanobium sp. Morenito 9A2 TaxID=2823718 RepID=UPI0020CD4612|nr:hypothetical protein [Cyanobium sp. Morenito 9A2]MCP9849566.1 hypothetical protein [Cyanobium sp. Morenito 9A2]
MTWAERLEEADVHRHPFPHLVIDDFLPDDLLAAAIRGFPNRGLISDLASRSEDLQANSRASLDLATVQACDDPRLDDLKGFYQALGLETLVRSVFTKLRPFLEDQLEPGADQHPFLPRMSPDDRQNWLEGIPSFSYDIQPGINPPQFAGLEPHLDDKYEIFAGLLYLHPADMPPVGGDLILYECGPGHVFDGTRLKGNAYVVKPVKRIAYRHNRFVALLNGQSSLHGVTPYLESDNQLPRRLYNIITEAYNIPYKSYRYWDLARGKKTTTIKHAVKGAAMLLRHRLARALFPSRVAAQLRKYTPGEVMDRWEFWA